MRFDQSGPSDVIRVLIVEDHLLVAEALAASLAESSEFAVVGHAISVRALATVSDDADPDVVLMDFRLPDGDGAAASRQVLERWPDAQVVMLSAVDDEAVVGEAVRAGCIGFLTKDRRVEDIKSAVRAAARGQIAIPPHLLARLVSSPPDPDPSVQLTERELQILQMIAEGGSTSAIAETLYLSPHTVRNHVRKILRKLDTHSKLGAVTTAATLGLVSLPGSPWS